jgi:hypothetical protein
VATSNSNKVLGGVSISGGSCKVAADGLSYACETDSYADSWSGTITFTVTGGYLCGSTGEVNQGDITLYGSSSGTAAAIVAGVVGANQLDLEIWSNVRNCP